VPQGDSVSILCIDDEPAILEGFERILGREEGFQVQTSSSAEEALELINDQAFDVIISDYALPGMDGITLLREIRNRGYPAVFVIVTGKRLSHIAIDALNSGADYYLQKGADLGKDINKLIEFIRASVTKKQGERALAEWERFYASCVESHTDIICRILPDGKFTFVNEFSLTFFKKPYEEMLSSDLFSFIPPNERTEVLRQLQNLSQTHPDALMEHHITTADGTSRMLQWKYHGIFTSGGAVSEFQVSGRDTDNLIRVGALPVHPVQSSIPVAPQPKPQVPSPRPIVVSPVATPAPAPVKAASEDWKLLIETVHSMENPVFAVNKAGVVIAWNSALEQLTGVKAGLIVGKGRQEYAVPFYGRPEPMLIDHIISPNDVAVAAKFPNIRKVGDTYIGAVEQVTVRGKPMLLWGKGTAVFDGKGVLIAALEAITVGEPQAGAGAGPAEDYIGGLSSLTLKVAGEGMGGAIAGAIGASDGGYGIYATSLRLFVIRNPELDVDNPQGVQFGTFIMDELFGTTVDTRPRSIENLEKSPIFVAEKEKIARIDVKKPVLLSGYINITVKNGGSFRVYVDHKKAFSHIEKVLQAFYPEIIRAE